VFGFRYGSFFTGLLKEKKSFLTQSEKGDGHTQMNVISGGLISVSVTVFIGQPRVRRGVDPQTHMWGRMFCVLLSAVCVRVCVCVGVCVGVCVSCVCALSQAFGLFGRFFFAHAVPVCLYVSFLCLHCECDCSVLVEAEEICHTHAHTHTPTHPHLTYLIFALKLEQSHDKENNTKTK